MKRFENQPLRSRPHIAICGADKVGNFVVTTPMLRGLKAKYPGAVLDFYGSSATRSLEERCAFLDARFSLFGEHSDFLNTLSGFVSERREAAGPYDLAINCNAFSELSVVLMAALDPDYVVGASLRPDFRGHLERQTEAERDRLCYDEDWNSPTLATRYGGLLQSSYIAEIFCALAYVETDYNRVEVPITPPSFAIPEILLHMTATRPAKQWLPAYWKELIQWCHMQGLSVGVVGRREQEATEGSMEDDPYDRLIHDTGILDLRDCTTLPELAGAFKKARAAVVVDAGPMHIAAAVDCQTVCLFGNDSDGDGASPIHLWAPRGSCVHLVNTPLKCTQCAAQHFRNPFCLRHRHLCMEALLPQRVIAALVHALDKRNRHLN